MTHPSVPISRLARTAIIAATLCLLAVPGHAVADRAAIDEYSLKPAGSNGVTQKDVQRASDAEGARGPASASPGVVGERVAAQSPLQAAGSSLAPATPWLAALLAALGGLVAARWAAARRRAR